jgi:DNA modification methylase
VWPIKKVNPQSMVHLTEKPVELAVRAIQYSSLQGENVLDLFGGSGSTLIACEQTKRHAFLMELDTLYCDVIRQRWAEFVHGAGCDWKKLTPSADAVKAQEARKCVRASRKAKR